ncbi:MAG: tagaturonate reductase [Mucilaginibacter sp.]|nr:tagaturonate reductase [Mucilaginibacter sp.]
MQLSRNILPNIPYQQGLNLPNPVVFTYPEKVLQFGTGVFIRGLIDYYINNSNNQEGFKGRVVMVKSTAAGNVEPFNQQDNLYTLVMKSVTEGEDLEKKVICAAISRTIDASDDWESVLACAANPDMQIIISNTTEAGITLIDNDSISTQPPVSFPAKLLSFLLARFEAFDGSPESGMVIIPTELIPENATKLKQMLNILALQNQLEQQFIDWLNTHNDFCNSLVDRIVPGKLPLHEELAIQQELGYTDNLMIMSETFDLWAIETASARTRELLAFHQENPGINIVPDISKFRELKMRLLNGSHNLSCAIGFFAGFKTVKEAMADEQFDIFMQRLINVEIAAAIVSDTISLADAREFGNQVLDRYRNPYIAFNWLDICVQDTAKIRIRAVPVVRQHYEKYGSVSDGICLGFAAYILFMRGTADADGNFHGSLKGEEYLINDDYAARLSEKWAAKQGLDLVRSVLSDEELWGADLSAFRGFASRVAFFLDNLLNYSAMYCIKSLTPFSYE